MDPIRKVMYPKGVKLLAHFMEPSSFLGNDRFVPSFYTQVHNMTQGVFVESACFADSQMTKYVRTCHTKWFDNVNEWFCD